MLDRTTRDDRRRARCRARVQTHRRRLSRGEAIALVTYNGSVVDLLVRSGWISDVGACDRRSIGLAISNLLNDIAENA
jgi:hypothetical protein